MGIQISKPLVISTILLFSCNAFSGEAVSSASLVWAPRQGYATTVVEQKTLVHPEFEATRIRLSNEGVSEEVRLFAQLEPSLLHFDYVAEVKLHSETGGVKFGAVVVFPHQDDPKTGKALEMLLLAGSSSDSGRWQNLRVEVTQKTLEAHLRTTRAQLNRSNLNTQQAVITGLVLIVEATPGDVFLDIGPATPGKAIPLPKSLAQRVSDFRFAVEQEDVPLFVPVDVELGGLTLNHRPAILRFAPDHNESIDLLRQLGLNAVWVSDGTETDRTSQLFRAELAVFATPPHPEFEPSDYSKLIQGLPPLDQSCPNVSAWYQGSRVSPEEQEHLLAVSREVRSADRRFQRLQMADVTANEGAVAREIDLVGIGRHVVGRDITFGSLRNLLVRRKQNAGQLSFPWVWVQVEPSSYQQSWRQNQGFSPQYVEPEQIQHGVYAALSAGYKGIGFWKTRPFNPDDPGDRETMIAIELSCMEIELLEPFLARGLVEGYLALQSGEVTESSRAGSSVSGLSSAIAGRNVGVEVVEADGPLTHDAAVVTGGGSTLILATAWDQVSQFVPGAMYESSVDLVVASSETASAWQISTTGISGLPREVTAGGLPVRITGFERSAAVIVTSSPSVLIPDLRNRVHKMAPKAAGLFTELASLKYMRALRTIDLVRQEHMVPQSVDNLMVNSKLLVERAQKSLENNDFHEAAAQSRKAMVGVRKAQQLCWAEAVSRLTTAASSPHTLSFSTLPDHWKLVHYLERQKSRLSDNLLESGGFEKVRTVSQDGWSVFVPPNSRYSATSDIVKDPRAGHSLRLIAWKPEEVGRHRITEDVMPLTVTSPPIAATSGDVMVVSGRVRKGRSCSTNAKRPLLIFDSELGVESSVRAELESDWISFQMIRPVSSSGSFSITFGLVGEAEVEEVYVDDIVVQRLPQIPDKKQVRFTGNQVSNGDASRFQEQQK